MKSFQISFALNIMIIIVRLAKITIYRELMQIGREHLDDYFIKEVDWSMHKITHLHHPQVVANHWLG